MNKSTFNVASDSSIETIPPQKNKETRARQMSSLLLRSKNLSPYREKQKTISNFSSGNATNRGGSSSQAKPNSRNSMRNSNKI